MNRYGTPDIYRTLYHHAAMTRGWVGFGRKTAPGAQAPGAGESLERQGFADVPHLS